MPTANRDDAGYDCIVLPDDRYYATYKSLKSLKKGRRFVMYYREGYERIKMAFKGGNVVGLPDGNEYWLPVAPQFALNMVMANNTEKHIRIDALALKGSKKESHAYLDNITTRAHELRFPLYGVQFTDTIPGGGDDCVLDVSLERFNGMIEGYRGRINEGIYLTKSECFKEQLEPTLKTLCDEFRKLLNCDMSKYLTSPEMYRARCCYMKLEIDFFLKFKKFFECSEDYATLSECNAIAKDLRDEYPLSMFNMSLMEFFDASKACSEGFTLPATEYTKYAYSRIECWHLMLGENFYNNQLEWRLP